MFEKLKYRILNRSIDQFIADKKGARLPDFDRLNSVIIIIEDLDKQTVRAIEDRVKTVFGITRTRFIIISEKASDDMLRSDQYCEVTTQDFGFMKVLTAEKQEEIRKLPMTHLLINMAKKHSDISDYMATLPNASFRVSFQKSDHFNIYDLIVDTGEESDPTNDVKVLYDYLVALSGGESPVN
ncbi:MAG: hypothetical protein K6A28_01420 [Bacteroidales bacterium]|nr:hypothetical protein [Bacteroidales bacterium]